MTLKKDTGENGVVLRKNSVKNAQRQTSDTFSKRCSLGFFVNGTMKNKSSLSVSKLNLLDDGCLNGYRNSVINNNQNSGMVSPIFSNSQKQKTSSWKTQDILPLMDSLYNTKDNDRSNTGSPTSDTNGDHIDLVGDSIQEDDLPTELSPEWIREYFKVHQKTKKAEIQLSTIHEFLSTELNFLNQLQYMLDVSSKVVSNLQLQFFKSIRVEEMFLNVGEIYEANYQFWSNYLYPSYKEAVENKTKVNISQWKDGFQQMNVTFDPYKSYCARIPSCQKNIQNMEKTNKYFNKFSQWFSSNKPANRESLTDFIVKPFQRLTKYELLLNTILKYSDETDTAIDDLRQMIQFVNQFMKIAQQNIVVSGISIRLEPIDFVDSPTEDAERQLCASFRVLDLTQPIQIGMTSLQRDFISVSHFKMKESHQYKAIEVTCYLFTDMLLICQRIKNTDVDPIKLIRPIVPIRKVFVKENGPGQLYLRVLTEFDMLSAMYLFTGVIDKIESWMNTIISLRNNLVNIPYNIPPVSVNSNTLLEAPSHCKVAPNSALTTPHLQVTSPSPIPGRSPSPEAANKINIDQLKQQNGINVYTSLPNGRPHTYTSDRMLNRNHPSNSSFVRSSYYSSPNVRKRIPSENDSYTKSLPRHQKLRESVTYKKSYSISSPNDSSARFSSNFSSQSTMNLCTTNEALLEEDDYYLEGNPKDEDSNNPISSINSNSNEELNELNKELNNLTEDTGEDNLKNESTTENETCKQTKESIDVSKLVLNDDRTKVHSKETPEKKISVNPMMRMKRKYQSMNSLNM